MNHSNLAIRHQSVTASLEQPVGAGPASVAAPDGVLPRTGSLAELVRLLGSSPDGCDEMGSSLPLPILRIKPNAVLHHEGSSGQTLFVVRSGSFKCVRTLEDGYEQVLSFAQAGELLGFEALHGGMRQSSAIALEWSTVYALPVGELRDLQRRCPPLEEAMRRGLSRQLARAGEVAEMMSAVASDARVGRFILWLSARMAEAGQSASRIRLRMGRRDIASLLGLAHETISRSFTMLADSGCLWVDNREVEILDMEALRVRARNTRRPTAEPMPVPAARQAKLPDPTNRWWSSPARAA